MRLPLFAAVAAAVSQPAQPKPEVLPIQPLQGMNDAEIEAAITKLAAQEGKVDSEAKPELQSESEFFKLMTNDKASPTEGELTQAPCGDLDCGCACGNAQQR